jgi:ERF superfamily
MEHSSSIAALATALAKAQGVMGGALKDSANPFFKSKYADLESVWAACRKPLADNGLSVIQGDSADDAGVMVTTMLAHESGEWIKSTLRMVPKDSGPQAVGSCISYARRYALASMVGIYQSDDDAEKGSGRGVIDPRGEAYKAVPEDKAKQLAQQFRDALDAEIDGKLYELHLSVVDDHDLYIAISAHLNPSERAKIKAAIQRMRESMPKVLPNGRQAVVR